jgi:hypothetical protein
MKKNPLFLSIGLVAGAVAALVLVAASAAAQPASAKPSMPYDYDVGLVGYTFWDTVFVGDTYMFDHVTAKNYGQQAAFGAWLGYLLFDGDSNVVFEHWYAFDLSVGDSDIISLPATPKVYDTPGVYIVCDCTLDLSGDQNPSNDGGIKHVVVLPRPGVEDAEPASLKPCRPVATLATSLNGAGGPEVTWYTVAGSRVRSAPARPGIYFHVQGRTARRVVLVR